MSLKKYLFCIGLAMFVTHLIIGIDTIEKFIGSLIGGIIGCVISKVSIERR